MNGPEDPDENAHGCDDHFAAMAAADSADLVIAKAQTLAATVADCWTTRLHDLADLLNGWSPPAPPPYAVASPALRPAACRRAHPSRPRAAIEEWTTRSEQTRVIPGERQSREQRQPDSSLAWVRAGP